MSEETKAGAELSNQLGARFLALFATKTPKPEFKYSGFPTSDGVVYIRAIEIEAGTDAEAMDKAYLQERVGETFVNTLDIEST